MELEEALRGHLIAYAGLTALTGTRVYPVQLAQNATLPAITFQRISTDPTQHRDGPHHERTRMQIDIWATTYGATIAVREQVRAAMATFTRPSNPRVDVAILQDIRDLRDPDSDLWRASMDYFLFAES